MDFTYFEQTYCETRETIYTSTYNSINDANTLRFFRINQYLEHKYFGFKLLKPNKDPEELKRHQKLVYVFKFS